jgi:hypothetical protein
MRLLLFTLIGLAAGCDRAPSVSFGSTQVLNAGTDVGAAPMIALSPSGARTVAWVSAPGGGSDGRLYVSTNDGPVSELRDSLGGIEPHGEAPPKVGYAPNGDSTLYALYAVGKVIPGRRFPFTTLRFASSPDRGTSWNAPRTVAGDSIPGSRNFHAMHVAQDGTIYVAWLESSDESKSGTYLTRSSDGGVSWSKAVRVASQEACPCCRTAIATASDGTLYLAWRSVAPGNVRDIVVATSRDKGQTWTTPKEVHADNFIIDGCPHAGPSMLTDSAGRVHIAWWTGAKNHEGVYYARSDDGAQFGPAIQLSSEPMPRPAHVQLALGANQTVAAVWDDAGGTRTLPRVLMRISGDGGTSFGDTISVSEDDVAAMFPVLTLRSDTLSVAWTQHTPVEHEHAEGSHVDMKDPKATMPLPTVGAQRVLVRQGAIGGRPSAAR